MRRPQVRLSAALFVIVTTAGCFASTGESGEAIPAVTEPPPASLDVTSDGPPEGRFYILLQGANPADYDLYELRFSPGAVTRITTIQRVSSVGACPSRVVVAAGQAEVGYSDHIQEVQGRRLVPLDGLGLTEGFTPSLGPDCRVAYGWPDRTIGPNAVGELRVWDPQRREGATLYRAQPGDGIVASAAWGPNGKIAALRLAPPRADPGAPQADGRPAAIVVMPPDGPVTELDPAVAHPGLLEWGKTWMALSDEDQRSTVFYDPATRQRVVLPGWRPLAWSPDGTRLLVSDSATEQQLGIVEESNLTSVREVGVLNRAVGGGVWLAD